MKNIEDVPKVGEIWRHFKHDPSNGPIDHTYQIEGVSLDMEDDKTVRVHYRPLYDAKDFLGKAEVPCTSCVRTLEDFCGEKKVTVDGEEKTVKRFTRVTDEVEIGVIKIARFYSQM